MECGYSPKQIAILSFGSPVPALPGKVVVGNLSLVKNTAVRRSCSLPHSTDDYKLLHTHKHLHSLPLPPSLASVALKPASLTGGSVASAENGRGSGRLPAGAGSLPLLQSVSMVYVLLLRCFFPVLTLYSPRSLVWGLFFFPSSCYAVIFFNSLSSCPVYPLVIYVCYVWAG